MRYFGSKKTVIEDIYTIVSKKIPCGSLCDPFGGIAIVGSYFKEKNFQVFSGDNLKFAYLFQVAKLEQNSTPLFRKLLHYLNLKNTLELKRLLNDLKIKDGWFVNNYSILRKFFTLENARKIEACWQQISLWNKKGILTFRENAILVVSLINSMDKVANTAGTYYAYLKNWYRKALRPFRFEFLSHVNGNQNCKCYYCNAIDLVKLNSFDILYLDPPYNERSYSSYYHLPETIALDETPKVHGKSGIPTTIHVRSPFNRRSEASNYLKNILENSNFRLLVFHYFDEGIIKETELLNLFGQYGKLEKHVLFSKGYTNKNRNRDIKHNIYLVEKYA